MILLLFGIVLTGLLSAHVFSGSTQPLPSSSGASPPVRAAVSVSSSPVPARRSRHGAEAWRDTAPPSRGALPSSEPAVAGDGESRTPLRDQPPQNEVIPHSAPLPESEDPETAPEQHPGDANADAETPENEVRRPTGPGAPPSTRNVAPVPPTAGSDSSLLRRGAGPRAPPPPPGPALADSLPRGRVDGGRPASGDGGSAEAAAHLEARLVAQFEARLAAEAERLSARINTAQLEARRAAAAAASASNVRSSGHAASDSARALASPDEERRLVSLEDQLRGLQTRLDAAAHSPQGPPPADSAGAEVQELRSLVDSLSERHQQTALQVQQLQQQQPAPPAADSSHSPALASLQSLATAVSELRAEAALLWEALANVTAAAHRAGAETEAVRSEHDMVLAQLRALETAVLQGGGGAAHPPVPGRESAPRAASEDTSAAEARPGAKDDAGTPSAPPPSLASAPPPSLASVLDGGASKAQGRGSPQASRENAEAPSLTAPPEAYPVSPAAPLAAETPSESSTAVPEIVAAAGKRSPASRRAGPPTAPPSEAKAAPLLNRKAAAGVAVESPPSAGDPALAPAPVVGEEGASSALPDPRLLAAALPSSSSPDPSSAAGAPAIESADHGADGAGKDGTVSELPSPSPGDGGPAKDAEPRPGPGGSPAGDSAPRDAAADAELSTPAPGPLARVADEPTSPDGLGSPAAAVGTQSSAETAADTPPAKTASPQQPQAAGRSRGPGFGRPPGFPGASGRRPGHFRNPGGATVRDAARSADPEGSGQDGSSANSLREVGGTGTAGSGADSASRQK